MKKKDTIDEELNLITNDEIEQCSDLQKALDIINKEQVIPEAQALVKKNFIVKSNENLKKELANLPEDKQNDAELDTIADQADSAFYDLMEIAVNSSGKACGDIAAAAQQFLNIKMQAKLSKTELKLKKMKMELDQKKFEVASKPKEIEVDDDFSDDGITIIENPQ